MAMDSNDSEYPASRKEDDILTSSFVSGPGTNYQHKSYPGNKYLTPSRSNPDLLHQALLPPSRFVGNGSPLPAPYLIHQDDVRTLSSRIIPTIASDINNTRGSTSARRRVALSANENESRTNHINGITESIRSRRLRLNRTEGVQKIATQRLNFASLRIPIAVLLWYLLGVMSIGTTKLLLRDYEATGMSPLALTVQQLFIGLLFLWLWIYVGIGTQLYHMPYKKILSTVCTRDANAKFQGYDKLILSAAFFTSGFWLTNVSFSCSDASFVETIKASEPITSAGLAALWGLEHVSSKEVLSLILICVGLVISTVGNSHGASFESKYGAMTLMQSFISCGIIMGANLSFSFRGLYQKIFRSSPNGSSKLFDDLNLQYRIHEVGLCILLIPFFFSKAPALLQASFGGSRLVISNGGSWTYLGLSIINGFAFTHYNLASSYILSRISVVHHAALNCMRRIFAIVITSIAFGVPVSFLSVLGILISLGGFLLFTCFKVQRKKSARPLSSLLPVSRTVQI